MNFCCFLENTSKTRFNKCQREKKLIAEKVGGASMEVQNERPANSKPLKEKMTKAERRALQEAQRAAKAAAKGACFSFVAWDAFLPLGS